MIESITTGVVAILVCMINNHYQQEATKEQHNKTVAIIEYKIEDLAKKVDLHNNAVERLYLVEKKQDVQDEKIKVVNRRIEDLEK